MNKSLELLKQYWGYDSFRLGQDAIIQDVVNGHDTLALLPTGGGKSICFQVPGIAREGITIVISPLIALMQDQVENLTSRGIRAKAIISGMTYREIDILLDNARFGGLDFLYTSPERIQSSLFIERFKRMNVGLIVVDEAHCISEWGHDFRPSFKEIKKLRLHHPEVPIIAVTATATEKTKNDIIAQLELKDVRIHQSAFERSNLIYESYASENKLKAIVEYCENHPNDTGIIYCQTRKSVKFVARALHAKGIKIGIYHGGMSKDDRKLMLIEWMTDTSKIMIATNAFGMGIDKPDVRFVLHYEFPASLEAYFQEAGRAGRDGQTAVAINYFEKEDVLLLQQQAQQKFPEIPFIKKTYRGLCNYLKVAIGSGKDETYNCDIKKFCHTFNFPINDTYHAIKFLELSGEMVFSEGVYHPTKVKFAIGNTALYNFQLQNETLNPLIILMSRSYPGIFDSYFDLHEKEFCKRLSLTPIQLEKQLKTLEQYGVIDVSWRSDLPTVTFLRERLPDDYLELKPEIYLHRKEIAQNKLKACMEYLTAPKCRAQQLINYFGIASEKCGKCDVCSEEKNTISDKGLSAEIIQLLTISPLSTRQLKEKLHNHKQIDAVLRSLILDEKIRFETEIYHLF